MISVLQNQQISRFSRYGARRPNAFATESRNRAGSSRESKLGIKVRHGVVLLASAFLAAYFTASSGIFRLLSGPSAGAPMPHTAGQEAEILAKPGPHALLSTAFEQASGGHTPENRAWIPGNADGLSPMLQTSAAHTADGLASALQTALTHRITKGETLYEIAQAYQLPLLQLILWNRITDPTKIQPGKAVRLTRPSRDYQKKPLTETPTIAAAATTGTAPFELELSYPGSIPEGSFLWDLGDWRFAFNKTPTHVYSEPGLYTVKLRSFDNSGQEHSSNSLTVRVFAKGSKESNKRYITLDSVDEILNLGDILERENTAPGSYRVSQKPVLFEATGENEYVAIAGGYSRLAIQGTSVSRNLYTFVSPIPSRHSWEPDYDWYKTQFGTGIRGNCGPATVAMASYWASGIDTAVGSIRSEIGMPYSTGAITFHHMLEPLQSRGVSYSFREVNSVENLKAVVDRGNIGIVLINTTTIERTPQDPRDSLIGRYYWDNTGHYVIVKGYTLDGEYFVVYDPIPSDWSSNRQRYQDGSSMLGRNRYYPSTQFVRGMKTSQVLEVIRN